MSVRLRVMTFNIHGGAPETGPVDLRAIAAVIAQAEPDLVGLQEVFRNVPRPGSPVQDQPRLLRAWTGMDASFIPSIDFGVGGYGNALLSRLRPDEVQRVRLPLGREPRTALEGRFTIEGRPIRFVDTHLGLTPDERLEQARRLAALVRESEEPAILVGDLNAAPDSPEVGELLAAGLADCLPVDALTFPARTPDRRLDYILATPHFRVDGCQVVETLVSDHRPVVAELVLE